jgi:nitroreductase
MLNRAAKLVYYRVRRLFSPLLIKVKGTLAAASLPAGVFDREITAMNAGIRSYMYEARNAGSRALLRRNIHRLEKGLIMQPRRDLFAVDYVAETVDALARRLHRAEACPAELAWATDVLRTYFEVTRDDETIRRARARFTGLVPCLPEPTNSLPYARGPMGSHGISFEQLQALALHRRSVRWFLPMPVPRELIEKAMLVAREAPSACNRQPFVFRAFDQPARVRQLAKIPMGATGFAHQIPLLIVVVGQQRNFFDPRDRHLIYIDGALAGMSFVLALETLGLSSCVLNWPDIADREAAMREALNLEPDERPVFLIAVGYPDPQALVARSTKRPIPELLRFE